MLSQSKPSHIAGKCYHRFDLSFIGPNISENNNSSTRQANNPNQNS